ncbi:MAG: ATP synthase F1 subunit delta [Holophaga sp.]|nr:ATP synthase F1 subunit delta [Holophaga sp.]
MSNKLIARRYAKALVEIGLKQGTLQVIQKELAAVGSLVRGNADLERLVSAPLIGPTKKAAAFDGVLGAANVSEQVRKFFSVVAQAARLNLIHEIITAFDELVDEHLGIMNAAVASAHPLSAVQTKALEASLSVRTGKTVRLCWSQDLSLLGGIKVQIGSTVYDASLQGQLRQLKLRLLTA